MSEKVKNGIELDDICPERAEFFLKSKNKTYGLRMLTLQDYAWFEKTFGSVNVFAKKEVDYTTVLKAVYHQLEQDSRKDFLAKTEKIIDDDGIETEKLIKGYEVLGDSISHPDEINGMMKAYVKTMGISQPVFDKLTEEEQKKKVTELEQIGD